MHHRRTVLQFHHVLNGDLLHLFDTPSKHYQTTAWEDSSAESQILLYALILFPLSLSYGKSTEPQVEQLVFLLSTF